MSNPHNITIVEWAPVAIWNIDAPQSECGICKNKLTKKCTECLEDKIDFKKRCKKTKGKCGHVFHFHCIKKWLNQGITSCPFDKTPWMEEVNDFDEEIKWTCYSNN